MICMLPRCNAALHEHKLQYPGEVCMNIALHDECTRMLLVLPRKATMQPDTGQHGAIYAHLTLEFQPIWLHHRKSINVCPQSNDRLSLSN